ncbi:GNAT family N-acetyltransferase [Paenibacillus oenotherae]|uniref:GNAT family N-acetyltransferase n=1 Tax=Paenibacillus oenotherae TaxID=1435645 RepID=A0ABS7D6S7_9BACL|nr:GNAT family N-acetyltransferase [Paenibacillus oenotherae]MBW7475575.1 GNAT family N-acetyltransferase [Paenibacillus oenotherae]
MSKEYKIIQRTANLAEYKTLCHAVGWTAFMNFDVAEESLNQSLFGVIVQYKEEIVGMGRVVGDGKIYFYIQDIAVVPEHQNKGIGNMIMKAISEYLKENAPEKSFVGLFASQGKESFYNKYGFNNHEGMTGMFGVIHEREIK